MECPLQHVPRCFVPPPNGSGLILRYLINYISSARNKWKNSVLGMMLKISDPQIRSFSMAIFGWGIETAFWLRKGPIWTPNHKICVQTFGFAKKMTLEIIKNSKFQNLDFYQKLKGQNFRNGMLPNTFCDFLVRR